MAFVFQLPWVDTLSPFTAITAEGLVECISNLEQQSSSSLINF